MQITDGGFVTTTGGLIIMHNCCGTPRGVNPNDKTVVISPPGRTTTGGLMKTLHRNKVETKYNIINQVLTAFLPSNL